MRSSKIRLFFGTVWIFLGTSKILVLIAELITGKAMVSLSVSFVVELTVVPFCIKMVDNYILPHAQLIIFAAALVEIIIGLLSLRPGGLAKLGLAFGVFLAIIYTSLFGWIPAVIGILLFVVPQMWLMGQDLNENLCKKLFKNTGCC